MTTSASPETLQGTDLAVGRAAFGTMTFGGQVNAEDATRMVEIAREGGVTMFDSANSYGDGESERLLGAAVKPFRDEVIIATKVGSRRIADPDEERLSPAAIRESVEESLRRLQTDVIDLYYLHMPDRSVDVEASLEAMDGLVRAGKVRYVAQSNYPAWEMTQMRCIAERRGFQPIRVSQLMYNMLARRPEGSYADCTAALGISNVVYNPLAGGLLTGKYFSYFEESGSVEGTRFERDLYQDRYWNQTQHEAVRHLTGLAADAGISLIEMALRWIAHQPLAHCVLLGASSADQLAQNLRAVNKEPLDPAVSAAVDAVWERLQGVAPAYWR